VIEEGDRSVVHFREGENNENPGAWEFWTVVSDSGSVTGRCRPGSDPGERFRRMEGDADYEDAWVIAASAKLVRPATQEKVLGWLNSHEKDARFAESCQIASRKLRVVETEGGFNLE